MAELIRAPASDGASGTAADLAGASIHGGPDAAGVPLHDFSTNSNACGPCPAALLTVQQADSTRYPDPAYTRLRQALAALHGVVPDRIVVMGSASEGIHRLTSLAAQQGMGQVVLPPHSYGDYAQAAQARKLAVLRRTDGATAEVNAALHWACEPASPTGRADAGLARWLEVPAPAGSLRVVDCAYRPLLLEDTLPTTLAGDVWQLWSPNKALGLTGVRAAYAIAPESKGAAAQVQALLALSPSWPVGAHGVAMLQAWATPAAQQWVAQCLPTLRAWKARQLALCQRWGWAVVPGSLANYCVAALPASHTHSTDRVLTALRQHGIKLRDCASFGLPGHVRLGVLPPASQDALAAAWQQVAGAAARS